MLFRVYHSTEQGLKVYILKVVRAKDKYMPNFPVAFWIHCILYISQSVIGLLLFQLSLIILMYSKTYTWAAIVGLQVLSAVESRFCILIKKHILYIKEPSLCYHMDVDSALS